MAATKNADAKLKCSKLTADLVAEVRAATMELPPRVIGELERLRKAHDDGKPFEASGEVPKGRSPRL